MKTGFYILFLILTTCTVSCTTEVEESNKSIINLYVPEVKYAKTFSIIKDENNEIWLNFLDPTTKKPIAKHCLTNGECTLTDKNDRIGIFSTSYIGYLKELDELPRVNIVENISYIYNDYLLEKFAAGKIEEGVSGGQLLTEKIILSSPKILLTSGMGAEIDDKYAALISAGIKVLPCTEWMENHPLARAEWIKVFGVLFNKQAEADSIFTEIEKQYLTLKEITAEVGKKKVLFSAMYGDTWYMPAGDNYLSRICTDAGATHNYINESGAGSLPISFESVVAKNEDVEYWINPDACSRENLLQLDERYSYFITKTEGKLYHYCKLTNITGGNGYWEQAPVAPHLVLKDMIKIFHPELLPEAEFTFYAPLK